MSILDNARKSIQIGMEDYHDDDPRRVLSAIRNLYAGILLIFKYKLQQLSPAGTDEALLKTRVMPEQDQQSGQIVWVGKGPKTVDVRDIIERFQSLGVAGVDFKRLNQLQRIRNDIEHYYSDQPIHLMKEAVANALHLIVEFCRPHLDMEPLELVGDDCWGQMLEIANIYGAEHSACQENLNLVKWPFPEVQHCIEYMRCPECESQLVKVINTKAERDDIRFVCSSCHNQSCYTEVVGPAVVEGMDGTNLWHIMDGGEGVTEDCPECGFGAYLNEQNTCAACFYQHAHTHCRWCEQKLDSEARADGDSVCGYCQNKYNKLMAE